ncbi:MAG: sodium:proton antiporter, partial [Bacteroidaceae bacterium]|nr:sodium:proton antiporter [Bacteroidaceae bacterium]
TPTAYSLWLALPCIAALATTVLLLMPKLPSRLELASTAGAYRGDDNLLPAWQRFLLLFIGIGGLWFIPTFHHLTQLPPFVGALCVVAVLWVVNELCNRKLMFSDRMSRRRFPTALQYANVQNMMLFTGLILSIAAVRETGVLDTLSAALAPHGGHMYLSGAVHGILGALVGNVTALIGGLAVFNTPSFTETIPEAYAAEGIFWPWLSLCTSLGGAMLLGGTVAGIFFERMEKAPLSWYLRHCSPRVFVGWVVAAVVFFAQTYLF